MAPPFREFARYIVRDLAIRTKTGKGGNATFSGNHSSPTYGFQARAQGETKQQFAARVKDFRRRLPRGSDSNLRLALAMEACMRAGDKSIAAAAYVLESVRKARIVTEKRRL